MDSRLQAYSVHFGPDTDPAELIKRETVKSAQIPVARLRRARRRVLNEFLREMRLACLSAVIQCCDTHPMHAAYRDHAAKNRAMLTGLRQQETGRA
jgi:hypothetical protein